MGHLCGSLGDSWGGSMAKEDFGGKTSKLAEAFIKKWSEGPQNSNANSICFDDPSARPQTEQHIINC